MSYQLTPTGQAIREIRKARGIRQRDVAEATNISASHLCRIEKGERVATQRVATAIYQYLGVEAA